jgi:hypothetical protein
MYGKQLKRVNIFESIRIRCSTLGKIKRKIFANETTKESGLEKEKL